MKMHIVTNTDTRSLWLCRAHTSQEALIKIAGRRGERAHLSSVPLDRQNPVHRSLTGAITRGQEPDAELLADWLRTLQGANPRPQPKARANPQPKAREGKTVRIVSPEEAADLRRQAKNLRAKARRQEAKGDPESRATRERVAYLLSKAKGESW